MFRVVAFELGEGCAVSSACFAISAWFHLLCPAKSVLIQLALARLRLGFDIDLFSEERQGRPSRKSPADKH